MFVFFSSVYMKVFVLQCLFYIVLHL